jgi:hypothetical protein
MSVYVGIDVHRKRSQVGEDGKVQLNQNVVNGRQPILGLIGGLPAGTPVAFEAGWLAQLDLPPVSREIITDCLAVIDALAPVIERLDGEVHQRARTDPRVRVLTANLTSVRTRAKKVGASICLKARFASRTASSRASGVPRSDCPWRRTSPDQICSIASASLQRHSRLQP